MRSKRRRAAAPVADGSSTPSDPSGMTERQQMAFLLRATAHEASESSSSSSDSSDDEEDEDDKPRRPAKRGRPRRQGKTSPRTGGATSGTPEAPVIYCGRGRPPKNSIKLPPGSHPYRRPVRMSPRSHNPRLKTPAETALGAVAAAEGKMTSIKSPMEATAKTQQRREGNKEKMVKQEKASPSSASDVAMLSNSSAPFCALCCDLEPFCDAPLFLCPACDQKYPTQQALGRVCMT
ncbi:hypothetical protein PHYBOEH_007338 [Phytophthora boehmeriae]|uniref:Uncharacterized protein n=1 Tax=Phytophthora boehmeriae TaxID=109152 RepID=A0A8T1X1L7_9STRA|nr:hypothetical protein PHYBOEH_007338 [Phytophthora boehmeriae]